MVHYWWVNQSDQFEIERRNGLVAARISESKSHPTHWGRVNVKDINKRNIIVCYRSGVGIDRLAYVKENLGVCDAIKIWEMEGDTGKAYAASVDYISEIKPIKKKDFWEDLKNIANFDERKGPIDNINQQVRYAYAMKLTGRGFDKIISLAESRNPGIVKNWLNKIQGQP